MLSFAWVRLPGTNAVHSKSFIWFPAGNELPKIEHLVNNYLLL